MSTFATTRFEKSTHFPDDPLFLYKVVLNREFEKITGVVRAKRRPYIPTVLSREEVDKIVKKIRYPYSLIVKLLYGCGLRLFECMKLRVQDLNFEMQRITIHDGKGQKDRTLPLPEVLVSELKRQIEAVGGVHQNDLENEFAGTFLPGDLVTKYKNAAKEFSWQWLFPAKTLTHVHETNEFRRYHLHESHVQKAIKGAVQRAQITKRASAHTFRHSYASHLLQANYDIRTIQELMGHSNVKTTMIYYKTVFASNSPKKVISPLDMNM